MIMNKSRATAIGNEKCFRMLFISFDSISNYVKKYLNVIADVKREKNLIASIDILLAIPRHRRIRR